MEGLAVDGFIDGENVGEMLTDGLKVGDMVGKHHAGPFVE